MFRWWLNSYSFVVYSPNNATVRFHQTFSIFPSSQQLRNRQCRRRLTISWNQFNNLNLKKKIIDVITNGNDLSTTSVIYLVEGTQSIFDQLLHSQNQVHLNQLSVSEQKTAIDTMTREVSHLTKFCNKVITNAFGLFSEVHELYKRLNAQNM